MVLLLSVLGCSDFTIDPIDPPGPPPVLLPITDRFVQAPLSQVDLLIVVDETASMAQELEALGSQIPTLLSTLDASGMDWQIGVVAADTDGAWPGLLLGNPYVLTPAHPAPQEAFRDRLPLAGGTGESSLEAARLALELSSSDGPNAGFLRAGALLQILFVSDADDQSVGADPVADLLSTLQSLEQARGARVSALVGDVPNGCASPAGTAQAGFRFHDLVDHTEGTSGSVCTIDFEDLLLDLAGDSVELPTRFVLSRAPIEGTLQVTLDGEVAETSLMDGAIEFEVAPESGVVIEARYVHQEDA